MSDRDRAMARAYVEEGLSYEEIAQRFGLTRQRVGQILGPMDLAEQRATRASIEREQRLREAHRRVMAGEVTLERAAAELGYASGGILRRRLHNLGLRVRLPKTEPPHGTIARYVSRRYRCRCAECREANRQRTVSLKSKKPPHHGDSGYRNYGCRCKVCKEGFRVALRARRAAKRKKVRL